MSKLLSSLFTLCVLFVNIILATDKHCDCNFPSNSPVCGDNDKTYNNREELECFNKCHNKSVQLKVFGACPSCECDANRLLYLVCGSDGRTYENPSVVDCRNECLYSRIMSYKGGACKPNDKALGVF